MRLWVLKMNTLVFLNSKKCDSLITYLIVCQKQFFKISAMGARLKAYYGILYTARGHNLNFYVGWQSLFFCPPVSFEKFFMQKYSEAKLLHESLFPR